MRITNVAFASALVFLCSCGSGGPSNTGEGGVPPQPRTVVGTQIVTYVSETGTTDVPDDLSKTTIAAYVPDASGGYTMLPGSGTIDGRYSIPDVPAGEYLLQIGSSHFWTSATNIDTGSQVQGRANPTPSTTGEMLSFDVALSVPVQPYVPSQPYDVFELVDPNLASGSFTYSGPNAQPSGTFNGVILWPSPLIDASLGDKSYLIHLKFIDSEPTLSSSQAIYTRTQEEMTPALSIQMAPGVTTSVTSSMVQGASAKYRANFRLSAFAALSSQMVAGRDTSSGVMFAGVAAAPPFAIAGGLPDGILSYGYSPVNTLATFQIYPDASASDLDLGDVAYHNGFPQDYKTLAFADWEQTADFSLSGAWPADVRAHITTNSLTLPTATQPLSPLLGTVTSLRLDSADVFNTQLSAVSLTPTISWQPPAVGVPNFYQVDVMQLTVAHCPHCPHPDYTITANVATFQTQRTSLTLPSGVLAPGSTFVLVVTAKNAVALNIESAPLRTTYPFAYADGISQMFTTTGTAPAAAAQAQGSYGPLMRSRKDLSVRRALAVGTKALSDR